MLGPVVHRWVEFHMGNPGLSRFMPPRRASLVLAVLLGLVSTGSIADSIELGGTRLEDVYIRESATLYYVCLPDDGRVLNIRKTDVAPGSVQITEDFETRHAIFARWKAHRVKYAEIPEDRMPKRFDLVTDSTKDGVQRSGPSESFLAGRTMPILRGKGVRRHDPELAARIQSNLARKRGGTASFVGSGPATGTASGGGGGGGAGGGGGGGGFFSNISDLFDTIDDAEVGEFPNPFSRR